MYHKVYPFELISKVKFQSKNAKISTPNPRKDNQRFTSKYYASTPRAKFERKI